MNWYIGQKVAYIGPDGDVSIPMTISKLSQPPCKCKGIFLGTPELNWAAHLAGQRYICEMCQSKFYATEIIVTEKHFRPLLDTFAEETLSKAKSDADEILEIMETLQEAVK
jgi:hypothetical protein